VEDTPLCVRHRNGAREVTTPARTSPSPQFFAARSAAAQMLRDASVDAKRAVKVHPELAGTYVQMRAAKLASQRLRDPQDQQRFVAQVRAALADSIARGEPLPPVRLRERSSVRAESRTRSDREPPQARS